MRDNADQTVDIEDEVTDAEVEDNSDELEAETPDEEDQIQDQDDAEQDGDDNDSEEEQESAGLTVTIEGEKAEEEDASAGIRSLRKAHKDQKARIKELEDELKAFKTPQSQDLGAKPTLESCDYDADKFEAALLKWNERKRAHDEQVNEQKQQDAKSRERYGERLATYTQSKKDLGAKDFDEAEEVVLEHLSIPQQSIIVSHAERPELVVYALGKNPAVAKRLAASSDLIEFAFELAKLERNLKVTGTSKPQPEKRLQGVKPVALSNDKRLAQLEAEAEKSGDYTKVFAHKRAMKQGK